MTHIFTQKQCYLLSPWVTHISVLLDLLLTLSATQCIAPTLIIARVASGKARPNDSWRNSSHAGNCSCAVQSSLHFQSVAHTATISDAEMQDTNGSNIDSIRSPPSVEESGRVKFEHNNSLVVWTTGQPHTVLTQPKPHIYNMLPLNLYCLRYLFQIVLLPAASLAT